jgi:hypothetical protein
VVLRADPAHSAQAAGLQVEAALAEEAQAGFLAAVSAAGAAGLVAAVVVAGAQGVAVEGSVVTKPPITALT